MSAKLMGQVWELELDHHEQAIMLALADHGEDDGTQIFPSVPRLAWKTGYSERQVQRILRRLEEKKLIVPVAHAEGGRGKATEYAMHLENAAPKASFTRKGDIFHQTKRVTSSALKGDISNKKGDILEQKGDTASAPQPSLEPSVLTIKEPSDIAAPKNSAAPPAENPSLPLPFHASDPADKQPPEPAKEKTTRGAPKARARKPKAVTEDAARRIGIKDALAAAVTGDPRDKDFWAFQSGFAETLAEEIDRAGHDGAWVEARYGNGDQIHGEWNTLPVWMADDGDGRLPKRPTLKGIRTTLGEPLENYRKKPKANGAGPPNTSPPVYTFPNGVPESRPGDMAAALRAGRRKASEHHGEAAD